MGIAEGLTKAADTPHDLFNGVRIFATGCSKAVAEEDATKQAAALKKALGMQKNYVKALNRLVKKVQAFVVAQAEQQKRAMEAMEEQKRQAEAQAAGGGDEDDIDDDFDEAEKDGDSADDDEF